MSTKTKPQKPDSESTTTQATDSMTADSKKPKDPLILDADTAAKYLALFSRPEEDNDEDEVDDHVSESQTSSESPSEIPDSENNLVVYDSEAQGLALPSPNHYL